MRRIAKLLEEMLLKARLLKSVEELAKLSQKTLVEFGEQIQPGEVPTYEEYKAIRKIVEQNLIIAKQQLEMLDLIWNKSKLS